MKHPLVPKHTAIGLRFKTVHKRINRARRSPPKTKIARECVSLMHQQKTHKNVFPEMNRNLRKTTKDYGVLVCFHTKSRNLLGYQLRSRSFKIHGAMQTDSHAFLACKTWFAQVRPSSHRNIYTAACHRAHQAVTVGLSFVQTKEKRANCTKLYKDR